MSAESAARIDRLVRDEPVLDGTADGVVGRLTQQCRALARAVAALGTGMSVLGEGRLGAVIASSGPQAAQFEELQFTLGEGPCLDAHTTRRPVLEPDLGTGTRWPGYSSALAERGVRAVFAFPMQVGAARLGILDVYLDRAGPLPTEALNDALDFAELGVSTLLDSSKDADAQLDLDHALAYGSEIYQAQGMAMIQLEVSLSEAMARMRAHAWAEDRSLFDVARDIIDRRLRLDRDDR